jgi:hypothetical protein
MGHTRLVSAMFVVAATFALAGCSSAAAEADDEAPSAATTSRCSDSAERHSVEGEAGRQGGVWETNDEVFSATALENVDDATWNWRSTSDQFRGYLRASRKDVDWYRLIAKDVYASSGQLLKPRFELTNKDLGMSPVEYRMCVYSKNENMECEIGESVVLKINGVSEFDQLTGCCASGKDAVTTFDAATTDDKKSLRVGVDLESALHDDTQEL